jgi:hypothetical protein
MDAVTKLHPGKIEASLNLGDSDARYLGEHS